jgi:hypothetical protein
LTIKSDADHTSFAVDNLYSQALFLPVSEQVIALLVRVSPMARLLLIDSAS